MTFCSLENTSSAGPEQRKSFRPISLIFSMTRTLPTIVHNPEVLPAVSELNQDIGMVENINQTQPIGEVVTSESIRPLPRLQVNERKTRHRKGTSLVLASSPEKLLFEKHVASKPEKSKRKLQVVHVKMFGPQEATSSSCIDLSDSISDNEPEGKMLQIEAFIESDEQEALPVNWRRTKILALMTLS